MTKLTQAFGRIGLVIAVLSLAALSATAQESKVGEKDVPAAVIAAFKAAYPTATIKGYAREKEHGKVFYEIESKDGETGRDVLYNPDGSVAEIEETIVASDLPAGARQLISSRYPGAVVTKVEKTTEKNASGDKIGYEVVAKQGKKRITLEFDVDGKLKTKAQ